MRPTSRDLGKCLTFIAGQAFVLPKKEIRADLDLAQHFQHRDVWWYWNGQQWCCMPSRNGAWWVREWHDWTPGVNDHTHYLPVFQQALTAFLSVPASAVKDEPGVPGSSPYRDASWRLDRAFVFRHGMAYAEGTKTTYPPSADMLAWRDKCVTVDRSGDAHDGELSLSLAKFCAVKGYRPSVEWLRSVAVPWAMAGIPRRGDGRWCARLG